MVLLVTNSDLRGALRTALTPYRLLGLAFAHDGQQRLQEDVEQGLHHHLHLLLHRCVLEAEEQRTEDRVMRSRRRRKVVSSEPIRNSFHGEMGRTSRPLGGAR